MVDMVVGPTTATVETGEHEVYMVLCRGRNTAAIGVVMRVTKFQ